MLEEAGIPTVIIAAAAFRTRMEMMSLPRVLLTPNPMGRPIGAPGDVKGQTGVILAALDLLEHATESGSIEVYPHAYRSGA